MSEHGNRENTVRDLVRNYNLGTTVDIAKKNGRMEKRNMN